MLGWECLLGDCVGSGKAKWVKERKMDKELIDKIAKRIQGFYGLFWAIWEVIHEQDN